MAEKKVVGTEEGRKAKAAVQFWVDHCIRIAAKDLAQEAQRLSLAAIDLRAKASK